MAISDDCGMFEKRHLAGIAASVALFAMFGLFLGQLLGVALGGVGFQEPVDGFETGPTTFQVYATEYQVTLPGVEVTHEIFGVTLSLSGFTVAEVSMGGGAVLGLLVGSYYAIVIPYENRRSRRATED